MKYTKRIHIEAVVSVSLNEFKCSIDKYLKRYQGACTRVNGRLYAASAFISNIGLIQVNKVIGNVWPLQTKLLQLLESSSYRFNILMKNLCSPLQNICQSSFRVLYTSPISVLHQIYQTPGKDTKKSHQTCAWTVK